MTASTALHPERPTDARLVDALIARAFGPGRFVKAAERPREQNAPLLALSPVAWTPEALVGCARLWPVAIGRTPALLLGPFAVDEAFRRLGLGAALIEWACQSAAKAGHALVVLVGDETYFGPLGFQAAPARQVIMPGPVDQRRVLARALVPSATDELSGAVTAAPLIDSPAASPHQSVSAAQPLAAAPLESLPSGV